MPTTFDGQDYQQRFKTWRLEQYEERSRDRVSKTSRDRPGYQKVLILNFDTLFMTGDSDLSSYMFKHVPTTIMEDFNYKYTSYNYEKGFDSIVDFCNQAMLFSYFNHFLNWNHCFIGWSCERKSKLSCQRTCPFDSSRTILKNLFPLHFNFIFI